MRRRLSILGVALVVLASYACGGGAEEGADAVADQGGGQQDQSGPSVPSFSNLYEAYLFNCANCHAPGAPGASIEGIEKSLDFSTAETAYQTLKSGKAQGLIGNQAACNGIPFIGQTYETSLLAAVLDEDVRANFQVGPCGSDNVSDMAQRVGQEPPEGFLQDLKAWIDAGAP